MNARTVAIIGAGPIGLEAALHARGLGWEVDVYEAGTVAEHFRRYGPLRLFTPFHMNATDRGRARLREEGIPLPPEEDTLTAEELRERYLLPLSRLPELHGTVHEQTRVTGIAREGLTKPCSIPAAGDTLRAERRFLLRLEPAGGEPRFETADAVVDASGVYETPNATGPGGLPAHGEEALAEKLERHLPAILGEARPRYSGMRVLLVGDGRSAANALVDLDALVRSGGAAARTRVEWVRRERGPRSFSPVPEAERTMLPVLRDLDERAEEIARGAAWIHHHPGAAVTRYRVSPSGSIQATLEGPRGKESRVEVDRVLALVGYRPDLSLFRELQVHLCYASEGPMALASALLAERLKGGDEIEGCLSQIPHGAESLRTSEPGFYLLGAKSYGRNPNFLLSLGHRQIADLLPLLEAERPRLTSTAR